MESIHAEFMAANNAYQETFTVEADSPRPTRHVAILTCMDARIDVFQMLGLTLGESHIIRNAGGIPTRDSIRSLCLSQYALGTTKIAVVQHTNCGLENLDEEALLARLTDKGGEPPTWPIGSFANVTESVRESVESLRNNPYLLHTDNIYGYVFDVSKGALTHVV